MRIVKINLKLFPDSIEEILNTIQKLYKYLLDLLYEDGKNKDKLILIINDKKFIPILLNRYNPYETHIFLLIHPVESFVCLYDKKSCIQFKEYIQEQLCLINETFSIWFEEEKLKEL